MGKLCMECLEAYRNDSITTTFKIGGQGLYQDCPKRMCDGKVFHIDDTILPIINLLNLKGYETFSSCGGHPLEENSEIYIEFAESVESLPTLPFGFGLRSRRTDTGRRLSVYYRMQEEDPYDQFPEILNACDDLYEWVMDLDSNDELFSVFLIDADKLDALSSLIGKPKAPSEEEIRERKKKSVEKLKEMAPDGSISLTGFEIKEDEKAEEKPEEPKNEEPVKKKRGRPKKEDKE